MLTKKIKQETSPEGNYPIYRAWLKTAEKSDKFCIPYLGVFLRDLTLSEEGNMSFLHDDVINWGESLFGF